MEKWQNYLQNKITRYPLLCFFLGITYSLFACFKLKNSHDWRETGLVCSPTENSTSTQQRGYTDIRPKFQWIRSYVKILLIILTVFYHDSLSGGLKWSFFFLHFPTFE